MAKRLVALFVLASLTSCKALPDGAECWSSDGRVLYPPELSADVLVDRETRLADARQGLASNPGDRDAAIWVGRRLGYLGRYREAIEVYTQALSQHPGDAFLLRHRGHRYISVREFGRACSDLARAAEACRTTADEVEPDGLPVPGRPPHSTLHFNVHYHHGLAAFLQGDFRAAEDSWLRCLACCHNDESRVAVTHWLWSVRMRRGDAAGAAAVVASIAADTDIVENVSYHQLCLLYGGKLARTAIAGRQGSSGAALGFGLAHHDLVTGKDGAACEQFADLASSDGWAAFGVIAAGVEAQRSCRMATGPR